MGTVTVGVKPVLVSEGKVVLTFKGGTGFDAPWIVVHATSLDDALDTVSAENGPKLMDLMTRTQNAGRHFAGLGPVPSQVGQRPTANTPAAAQQAPNGETRQCKHGEMQYKTGAKNGRVWKAYFCPSPKGTPDQCDAQFLRDN